MSKRVYLDYASLTPIDPGVLKVMKKYSSEEYANPSSLYKEGFEAKKALLDGRTRIAKAIHAHADEIVFTSGGTEANGLAIEGAGRTAHRNGIAKPHLIISVVEHSSVMETAAMMEKHGVTVTRLSVNADGIVSADDVRKAITPDTFMVSIMTVNNEIGSIQPIREIAKAVRWARSNVTKTQYPIFHTDAAQAPLYMDMNMEQMGVDLMTLDAAKMYGPRGMGLLYVRRGTPIEQTIYGGGQERGLRSGTENIPAIMGFTEAFEIATHKRADETKRIGELKEFFLAELCRIYPRVKVNGFHEKVKMTTNIVISQKSQEGHSLSAAQSNAPHVQSTPHILNVSIPGIDSEFFMLQLDAKGIAVSTKSSCLRDSDESYVLQAIGADSKMSLRFSFGRAITKADLKAALRAIAQLLAKR